MPNPFFYGGRITDPSAFVGRKAELARIFAALETGHTGQLQSVSIVGPRRIGRSSLLYHLTQVYSQYLSRPDEYRFAYVDLEDPRCQTLSGLLDLILDQLHLAHSTPVDLPRFVERMTSAVKTRTLPVICLDEFEHLTKNKAEFPDTLYDTWRSLANASQAAFVVSSQTTLDVLSHQGKLTSPFYNVFTLLRLGELTADEARVLVDRGRTCDRPFSDAECAAILKLAGQHPLKLQVAGSLVYDAKAGGRAVDWGTVARDYQRQVDYIFGRQPSALERAAPRAGSVLRIVLAIPKHLGRLLLDLAGRDKATDTTAWLVGVIIVIVVAALVLGVLNLDALVEVWKTVQGTKK